MIKPWQVLQSREVYSGPPWMRVLVDTIRLPDGREVSDYHRVEFQDCCIVYAETPDGLVVVERLYNHGPGTVGLSLPAGGLGPGEDPLVAAKRELLEETGYTASAWMPMGSFAVNGNYGCGLAHLFHASGAKKVAEPDSGDLEEMEILLMPRRSLVKAVRNGEVRVLAAAAAIGLVGLGHVRLDETR